MQRPKNPSYRRAFTLIELLIVIVIIAQLAAILFPIFSRVRETARRSSCQSNLKQIGLGYMQYSQDYDEYFPIKSADYGKGTLPSAWLHSVQPYIKSYQVFRCPSDTKIGGAPGVGLDYTSYAVNAIGSAAITRAAGKEAKWPYFPPVSEEAIPGYASFLVHTASLEAPSTTVQVLESNKFQYYSRYADFGSEGVTPIVLTGSERTMSGGGYPEGMVIERHLSTINVLWADGHVKAVKLDLLATKGELIPGTSDYAATYFTTKADPM